MARRAVVKRAKFVRPESLFIIWNQDANATRPQNIEKSRICNSPNPKILYQGTWLKGYSGIIQYVYLSMPVSGIHLLVGSRTGVPIYPRVISDSAGLENQASSHHGL